MPVGLDGNAKTEALAGRQDVDGTLGKGVVKEVPHLLRFSRVESNGRVLGGSKALGGDGDVQMLTGHVTEQPFLQPIDTPCTSSAAFEKLHAKGLHQRA